MNEIIISGIAYPLKFGMGFEREMNKRTSVAVEGMKDVRENIGARYAIAKIIDGDIEALEEAILVANKTEKPRLNMEILDAFIEDEETNIEEVFEEVLNFIKKANATAGFYKTIMTALKAQEENQ